MTWFKNILPILLFIVSIIASHGTAHADPVYAEPTGLQALLDQNNGSVALTYELGFVENFQVGTSAGWVLLSGDWDVSSGVFGVSSSTLECSSAYFDRTFSHADIEIRMRKVSGKSDSMGIFFNGDPHELNSAGNWVNGYSLSVGSGEWNLGKWVAGTYSKIQDWKTGAALNGTLGQWDVISIHVSDGTIAVSINGDLEKTFYDTTFTSGTVGVKMYDENKSGYGEFDYIKVTPLNASYVLDETEENLPVFESFAIYRDGVFIDSTDANHFVDTVRDAGDYIYAVRAQYTGILSGPSNAETVTYTGTEGVWTEDLTLSENPVYGGGNVTVSSVLFSNQGVAGGEYFVDTPGVDGSGTRLTSTDGAFDEQSEDVSALIVIPDSWEMFSAHTIYVHGRNQTGDWGEYKTVNLLVSEQNTVIIPDEYATIQEAIDHLEPGGSVYVRAGLYQEGLVIDKALSILGEDNATTIIDGNDLMIPVSISAADVSIRNFTVRKGRDGKYGTGHGILAMSAQDLIIESCIVTANNGEASSNGRDGIGISIEDSQGTRVLNTSSTNNLGDAAMYSDGHGYGISIMRSADTEIIDCEITGNTGGVNLFGGGSGYGIYMENSDQITIEGTRILSNNGRDCSFSDSQGGSGFGIYQNSGSDCMISDCYIAGNNGGNANGTQPGNSYGISIINDGSADILNNVIVSHRGGTARALFFTYYGDVCGIRLSDSATATISGGSEWYNVIADNSSYDVINTTLNSIDARYNIWSTSNPSNLPSRILDCQDNVDYGCVATDPLIPDSDGDYVPDDQDICPGHDDHIDVDQDGMPDGCDDLIDSDHDTIPDDLDQCPGHDDRVDVNNNGIPDGCDDPLDSDGDGVPDGLDICPGYDDHIDIDLDEIPDGCDNLIDSDGDGVSDDLDICPGHNDHVDTDLDGIPDGCDTLDPDSSEFDGLWDYTESHKTDSCTQPSAAMAGTISLKTTDDGLTATVDDDRTYTCTQDENTVTCTDIYPHNNGTASHSPTVRVPKALYPGPGNPRV